MAYDIVGAYDEEVGAEGDPQQVRAQDLPRHYAGAGPNTIAAGQSATFTFNLNMQLRPDHLVVPDAVAPNVAVVGVNIGAVSLNASADPAPGDMFRHDQTCKMRGAVSGSPSVPIKVTLLNLTSGAIPAVYLGIVGPCKRVN
jgi:hypothetical protein